MTDKDILDKSRRIIEDVRDRLIILPETSCGRLELEHFFFMIDSLTSELEEVKKFRDIYKERPSKGDWQKVTKELEAVKKEREEQSLHLKIMDEIATPDQMEEIIKRIKDL